MNSVASQQVLTRRDTWRYLLSREPQRLPHPGWSQCYISGGRGSGKTRAGAEGLADLIILSDDGEGDWAVIAPTFADARDTCVEGPSGLLRTLAGFVERWNRSQGQLHLSDGSTIFCDGADDGAKRTQGKNLRGAWCDEIGLWRTPKMETAQLGGVNRVQAWDESLLPAVRMSPAKIICTGTPKGRRGPLAKRLIDDPKVPIATMTMDDNRDNLSPEAIDALISLYGGTALGRQELEGHYVEDIEGALWTYDLIEKNRRAAPDLSRVVVAVDPPGGATEAGIVAAGMTLKCPCGGSGAHAFILDDVSTLGSPDVWGHAAVALYDDQSADRIVGEVNYGGDMVEKVVRSVRQSIPFYPVRATRGKLVRAEPIAALYEQGRVHHVREFAELESEMTTYTIDAGWSPNRLDALVWALTELGLAEARSVKAWSAATGAVG
jgi:phage terminase large subunit-like protein